MKFWQVVSFTEPDQLMDVARICEEVGFEGVMISDHLFLPERFEHAYPYSADGDPGFVRGTPWPEAWSTISAMAAVTTRLRFTTLVYILPLRHPLEVAKAVGTLAVLHGNRVAIGAGAGWMHEEFDTLGVDFKTRGRRFDESIEVLRKLWQPGVTEHSGEFFRFPRIEMEPTPSQSVPIFIGGKSRVALRRAARLGDGWLGTGQTPEEALDVATRLAALRAEAGRESAPFETIVPLTVPPEPDLVARLEDAGVTATTSYPFSYTIGPNSSLDQKRQYLEGYAESVIRRFGGR